MSTNQQELLRLKAISALDPDSGPDASFERMAWLVRETLLFPFSLVSLVDDHRQIFKSRLPDGSLFGKLTGSFCTVAVRRDVPLIVENASLVAPFNSFSQVQGAPHVRAYWGAPLKTTAGFNVGTLAVLDFVPRSPSTRDIALLEQLARTTVELMELRAVATTDVLTGVSTRKMFDVTARRSFREARKGDTELSCIVLDIDHFKSINDRYGHAIGDSVLGKTGELLSASAGVDATIGRIGGEEFALVLPGVAIEGALALAEKIRQRLEQGGTSLPQFTASLGVAGLSHFDGSFQDLVTRADGALYQAKQSGRNKTVVSENI